MSRHSFIHSHTRTHIQKERRKKFQAVNYYHNFLLCLFFCTPHAEEQWKQLVQEKEEALQTAENRHRIRMEDADNKLR